MLVLAHRTTSPIQFRPEKGSHDGSLENSKVPMEKIGRCLDRSGGRLRRRRPQLSKRWGYSHASASAERPYQANPGDFIDAGGCRPASGVRRADNSPSAQSQGGLLQLSASPVRSRGYTAKHRGEQASHTLPHQLGEGTQPRSGDASAGDATVDATTASAQRVVAARLDTAPRGRTHGAQALLTETKKSPLGDFLMIPGSGGRIRTYDLWVMSPTSCQLLHPAVQQQVTYQIEARWSMLVALKWSIMDCLKGALQ